MSLPVPEAEIQRRKKQLTDFMATNSLTSEDIVRMLDNTIRPVSLRTVKAWLADPGLTSARTPPLMLVDELEKRLVGAPTAKIA